MMLLQAPVSVAGVVAGVVALAWLISANDAEEVGALIRAALLADLLGVFFGDIPEKVDMRFIRESLFGVLPILLSQNQLRGGTHAPPSGIQQ